MKYLKLYDNFESLTEKVLAGDIFYIGARAYHVGKAHEMIEETPEKFKAVDSYYQIELADLQRYFNNFVKIDKEYAESLTDAALSEPGIFIVDGEFSFLIDGWHRAYALWKRGEESMNIWVIQDPEDIAIIKIR